MAEKSTQHYLRSLDVNEKLISSIDSGIIILDDKLTIHYYNSWLEMHTLIKEKDMLGKNIADIFSSINTKTLTRKIKTALRMGTPTFYTANTSKYLIPIKINQISVSDFTHMRQDVSVIPFDKEKNLVLLIISDQTNMTNVNMLLETNILKVQELNAELVKERETIDEKILLIKFNLEYKITDVSHAYLDLLEYEKDDILHKDFFIYEKFSTDDDLKVQIKKHMDEKKVFKFENKVLSFRGTQFILLNTIVIEYDAYGEHIGFILFMQNITDSKKVIEQQEKLLSTSRSAAMGEMISMIAHQWRQPLSVINTVMATVRIKDELDMLDRETTHEAFSKIENTVTYLSDTIDDFRDYFKPNKVVKKVSIKTVVEKSTSFLLSEIKLLNINYELNVDEDLVINTYQNELVQCLINILKNSIDAFKENSELSETPKYLTVDVTKDTNSISLSLEDNAGGIKQEVIKKVFEPYFSTKAKNGTGLGLYMTKTIIEEHLGGKITLTSQDAGTKMLIELPYAIKTKE